MRSNTKRQNPVVDRLRPVVYLYAALNIAVIALLFLTVSPTLAPVEAPQIASLR